MTRRLTSSSLAGTSRKLVAVGTPRLASMLATMRAAAPRMGFASSSTAAGFLVSGFGASALGASGAGASSTSGSAGAAAALVPLPASPSRR